MSAGSPLASQALAREVLEQVKTLESIASTLDLASGPATTRVLRSEQVPRLLAVMNRLRWACNQYANTIQGN